jgi:hypothetical protein
MIVLNAQPELRDSPQHTGQQKRGLCANGTFASYDFTNPTSDMKLLETFAAVEA